ncbi:MAG: AMP-binding protein [Alphaproteobacteria bacterium]|nr:AMP-binding protein [Alphaproteobacteria bacterium]
MPSQDEQLVPYLCDWLAIQANAAPNTLALFDLATRRQTSYHSMYDRSRRIASILVTQYGVNPGDRVMVVAYNSTDLYEILFACWRIGAIYMPVNWRLATPEIVAIVDDAEPTMMIADTSFESTVSDLDLPVLWRAETEDDPFETAVSAAEPWDQFVEPDLDATTNLLYTSGTTGRPKGVISTWRMQAMAVNQAAHTILGSATRTLTAAPMFHTAGLNSFALPLFYYGGTVHIMRHWDPVAALSYLSDPDLGITHTLGVPVQFQMMTQCDDFEDATFPSLERAGVGGAPVTEELLTQYQQKGLMLCNSYGMTEVFGVATLPPDQAQKKLGCVGWAVEGTEIRIADDKDTPVPHDTIGEIQIKSEGVTPGYWQAPDLTASTRTSDGWFRTGDMGRFDQEGALYVVDRKKDMFISGGENVYPAEIENVLALFPEIAEAAVIGVSDAQWGEVGHAVVVLKQNHVLDKENIRERCSEHLARYKVPKHVSFADNLPRSAQGKVQKKELKETYA